MNTVSSERCTKRIAIMIGSRAGANPTLKSFQGWKLKGNFLREW